MRGYVEITFFTFERVGESFFWYLLSFYSVVGVVVGVGFLFGRSLFFFFMGKCFFEYGRGLFRYWFGREVSEIRGRVLKKG